MLKFDHNSTPKSKILMNSNESTFDHHQQQELFRLTRATISPKISLFVDNRFLIELSEDVKNTINSIVMCKWLVVCTSCLFISILCWDMVGDKLGWEKASWVPIVGICILILLWLINYLMTKISFKIKILTYFNNTTTTISSSLFVSKALKINC